jgi:hypothetical protein
VPLRISGATLQPGTPEPLFEINAVGFTPFDVMPDGRFLVTSVADQGIQQGAPITVVLNWRQLLRH